MSLQNSRLIVSILALLLVPCLFFATGCSRSKDSFAPRPLPSLKLTAEVSVLGEKIIIINKDNFTWKDPLITITNGGTSKFFRIAIEDFKAGEKKIYSIDKFVNANGDTFESENHPLSSVTIEAQHSNGENYGFMHYF